MNINLICEIKIILKIFTRKEVKWVNINKDIFQVLPKGATEEIKLKINIDDIEEIRLKVEKPIIINTNKKEVILDYFITKEELKYIITKISNYSIYAFQEEIKQGYITFKGGHRIGLAGECVMENSEVKTIRNITSINIRMCKEIIGCSDKIMTYISKFNRVNNTLIVSPPKCGKTTLLRDITRNISNGLNRIGLTGKKVTVIDERSEIAGCYNGVPQMNVGIRTDVLDGCLKRKGILMAIRSLAPEVIICDEIGLIEEMEELNVAFNSGVNMILSVHGLNLQDVINRAVFYQLIKTNIIERIIILSNRLGPGTIETVYEVLPGGEVKCLSI